MNTCMEQEPLYHASIGNGNAIETVNKTCQVIPLNYIKIFG